MIKQVTKDVISLNAFSVALRIFAGLLLAMTNAMIPSLLLSSLLLPLFLSPFCTYKSIFQIHPSITAVSSCAYILTFIFDSILPPIFKVKLIFWWKKQPSCTIFTDMLKNLQDNRFTLSTVLEKYNDIYVIIDNLPKGIDQTPYWYSIYERNRSNPIVFGSNRDYLLLRDMHAQMVMLMVVYVALVLVTGLMDFSEPFIFYILFMIGALNVGARVQGKRVVYNVLSVDINAKKDE